MIRFDSVTKRYRGAPRAALDDVSLEIGSGEFVFLVGASGSGKSSLLRLVLREEKPSSGEIHVLGQRLTSISSRKVPYFRRSLGVVFQDFRLLPNKTVFDNVAFTLQVIGKSRAFIHAAVPDVLGMVGLSEKAQNLPTELSGGEQQRVAIARAVVNKPAVLLADEPTGNLDPTTSGEIMQVLERINLAGTTVVMATHDVSIVDRLKKRVVELVDGRIIRDELEAKYVTTQIPIQRRPEPKPEPEQAPEAGTEPEAPPVAPSWGRRSAARAQAQSSAESARPATGPLPAARPGTDAQAPSASWSRPAEATGEVRVPVWARSDSSPAVQPEGEQARAATPWRAAPAAPPAPQETDATSIFFAAPVQPARPPWVPAPEQQRDRGNDSGRPPARPDAAEPERPRERAQQDPAEARRGVRSFTGPIDLGNTGDPEGLARQTGRHRIPLPDHLDFVTGLGLRAGAPPVEDDEVGPSS